MPTPRDGESRSKFMSRCVPQVLKEGLRGKRPTQSQAVAACFSIWRGKKELTTDKAETKSPKSFLIWKERGEYKWFAVWSNKYRDDDNPPEIISDAAHRDFVKAVNDGDWPYPELWIWHVKGSVFGDSTYIDYDEVNGFTLAGGGIRKGMDTVVEALNSTPVEIRVSHGFKPSETRRDDPSDPTIITRYRSEEISPLPEFAAANKGTDFVILGGIMSEVRPSLRERLTAFLGGNEEKASEVADHLNQMGNKAQEEGLEFKENEQATEQDAETVDQEVKDNSADAAPDASDSPDADTKDAPITREEIVEAMEYVSEAMLKEIVAVAVEPLQNEIKSLREQIEGQDNEIKALKATDEEKIADAAAWSSDSSLKEMMAMRVIGRTETEVDGRKSLARSGPKETSPEQDLVVNTGYSHLNNALTNLVSGSALTRKE